MIGRAWRLWVCLLLGCADSGDHSVTPEEVREQGTYCCTHDGAPTTEGASCRARPGAVYLEDFSHTDASGRGDACGWILND